MVRLFKADNTDPIGGSFTPVYLTSPNISHPSINAGSGSGVILYSFNHNYGRVADLVSVQQLSGSWFDLSDQLYGPNGNSLLNWRMQTSTAQTINTTTVQVGRVGSSATLRIRVGFLASA